VPASKPHREVVAAAAAAAVGALFFFPLLAGDVLWFGDFHAAFEPLRRSLGQAWRAGFPLWNPDLANGAPVLANPFTAALYPPNLLFAVGGIEPARLLSWLTVAHTLWAILGTFLLARRLGQSPAGAATAAIVFPLSGAVVVNTYAVVFHSTFCWLPWLLFAAVALREAPAGRALLPVVGATAVLGLMLLSGEPFAVASGLLGGLLVLGAPGQAGAGPRRRAGLGVTALVAAALLASPVLLAAARYIPSTIRSGGLPPAISAAPSLHPLELLGVVLADPFGDDFRRNRDPSLAGFLQREGVVVFGALFGGLYVGSAAVGLAGLGVATGGRRRLVWAVWAGVLFLLALGKHGPLEPLFSLPGLNSLRYPVKWITAAFLPLALLAGDGVDALAAESKGAPLRRPAALSALAVLGLLAVVAVGARFGLNGRATALARPGAPPDALREAVRGRLVECAGVSALFGLGLLAVAAGLRRWRGPAAASLVAADLVLFNRALVPTAPLSAYRAMPAAIDILRSGPGRVGRVWVDQRISTRMIPTRVPPDEPLSGRALGLRRQRLDGYSGLSYGLRLAFPVDFEALAPRRYALLRQIVEETQPRLKAMLLAAAGVTHVVTLSDLTDDRLPEIARADISADAPLRVLGNRLVLPRARVVRALMPWSTPEELTERLSGAPDDFFLRAALVEAADLPALLATAKAPSALVPGPATLVRETGASVVLRASGPGWLVLSDTYAPGWRAEVDGRPAKLFPADVAFRLVPLPAGEHEVAFRYDPWTEPTAAQRRLRP
jgi:hypothetical protein